MKKKITSSALAALMIAGTTSFSALAAMPSGTVVIGSKAFDINYANDEKNADEITNAVVAANGVIYVKDFDGNWIDNVTNAKVLASVIPAVTYKSAAGVETKFDAKDVDAITKLEVASVSAITNTKVNVALTTAITSVPDVSKFVIKDAAGIVVPVSSVALSANGKVITLVTPAQKPYAAYTMTIGEAVKTYVGVPVDSTKPTAAAAVDGYNSVKVTFSEVVDSAMATNVANYAIDNNLTVLKAELDSTGKIVTLTTVAQTVGTIYAVVIQNVADLSNNIMDKTTNYFGGMTKDTSYVLVTTATVDDYNKVKVVFNKKVDVDTATNIANYVLDNSLVVLKAEVDSADTTGKTVVLTTADQTVGTIYKITINNVKDTLGNTMEKAVDNYFGAMGKDLSKATAVITVADNNKVTVAFDKKVDKATAENIANYVMDNSLVVVKAELDTDLKTVTLTTSPQVVGTIYKATVQNVATIYGTTMDKSEQYFGGMSKDITGPGYTVTSAAGKVTIAFNETIDADSATTLTNYSFDGGLGYPASATIDKTLDATGKTVVLTTGTQTAGQVYYVTVSNVKDINGNAISATNDANKKAFVGQSTSVSSVVKYQAVSIVNSNTIDLIFDTELTTADITAPTTLAVAIDKVTAGTNAGLKFKAEIQANKKVVRLQFETDASKNPDLFKAGVVYAATVSGVNKLDGLTATNTNTKSFAGTNVLNVAPEVKAVVPVDATTVKVIFTKPVKGITLASFTFAGVNADGVSVANTDVVSEVLVYLPSATTAGTVYKLKLAASAFTDSFGIMDGKFVDSATVPQPLEYQFAGTNVVNAKPAIKAVVPVDMYNFDIVFTEAVDKTEAEAATYAITNTTDANAVVTTNATKTLSADGTKLSVTLSKGTASLLAGKVYKVVTTSTIKDLAGLAMDVAGTSTTNTANFAGTNVANAAPSIVAVTINDLGTVLTVKFNEDLDDSCTFNETTLTLTAAGYTTGAAYNSIAEDDGTVTITLGSALTANQIASIKATTSIKDINGQDAKTDAVQFGVK